MNKKTKNGDKNVAQKLSATKGRAMLEWYGKHAPKSIEWFPAQEKEVYGDLKAKDFNKLFWGDNKQVLANLLKEYRGKIDLIYIDPPFDSKADYVKKIKLKGEKINAIEQSILEDMQYTDIWEKDEYLQFIYERLILMRELLSDKGSIYLHCDWHKSSYLRLIMDEVFGQDNFINEIIWHYTSSKSPSNSYGKKHDNIFHYSKTSNYYFKHIMKKVSEFSKSKYNLKDEKGLYKMVRGYKKYFKEEIPIDDVWDIPLENVQSKEIQNYPTQKPIKLLEQLIYTASQEGDLVADFFVGSGTTCATAQRMNRRWIGCDINKGSIITTTERLNKILLEQKNKTAFKVYNVNHYDIFNNDIRAKEILIKAYKIDELSRSDFDGTLGQDYTKIISPNRVLSKMDILKIIDDIKSNKKLFKIKSVSKQKESTFENKVIIICSGTELDVRDFVKKENKTGVEIEIRDIQIDKKEFDFKKPTEAKISYKTKENKLDINVEDYYSPLLMKRLELENEGRLSDKERVSLFDFRQAIEHIVIDINYGKKQKKSNEISFNAEVFLNKEKKNDLVKVSYTHEYEKKGKYTVAIKIVDVLGEEYFETKEITIK